MAGTFNIQFTGSTSGAVFVFHGPAGHYTIDENGMNNPVLFSITSIGTGEADSSYIVANAIEAAEGSEGIAYALTLLAEQVGGSGGQ